jgi:hypothetical protein
MPKRAVRIVSRMLLLSAGVLLGAALIAAAPSSTPTTQPYAPTSSYDRKSIRGWTIMVSGELLRDDLDTARRCLEVLDAKLLDITRVVPPRAVERLRKVPIWLERDDPQVPGGCYHPSRQWLIGHGFNPDKTKCVEFGNARHLLTWSLDQPMMVLHELAHAYHDQVLGYDNAEIRDAYEQAKASGIYEHVLRSNGHTERAYAMNNDQEYFAELSESYFGTNDFYPFVRAEVKQHDPKMYEVLQKVWRQ